MATALDYSAGRPSGAAIRSAGHVGVVRYCGTPGRTKNITKAEYEDLVRQGVGVALVFENRANDAAGGYAAGRAAAWAAKADADAIGFPSNRPIYFAVDSDQVTKEQFDAAMSYLDGAGSVLGPARVGVYGEFDVIERALPVHARFGWQCAAWSKGKRSGKAHIYQRIGTVHVGGIACDVNDILAADWGQHSAVEDDMQLSDKIKLWDGTEVTLAQLLAGLHGRSVDIRNAHFGEDPKNGGTYNDPFGAYVFTDNPGTPQARSVRIRDFYGEVRTQVARIDEVESKVDQVLALLKEKWNPAGAPEGSDAPTGGSCAPE